MMSNTHPKMRSVQKELRKIQSVANAYVFILFLNFYIFLKLHEKESWWGEGQREKEGKTLQQTPR